MCARGQLIWCACFRPKPGKRNDFNSPDKMECGIDDQTMFDEANRDREVGDDGIFRIIFARISIESGGKIDGEDERIFFPAQTIDLAGGSAEGLAQK